MIIYCVRIRISGIKLKNKQQARSLIHFCRGKAMSVIYYEFMCSISYSACEALASDYIVI